MNRRGFFRRLLGFAAVATVAKVLPKEQLPKWLENAPLGKWSGGLQVYEGNELYDLDTNSLYELDFEAGEWRKVS